MRSPQTLNEGDRRIHAAWAADCAERAFAFSRQGTYQVTFTGLRGRASTSVTVVGPGEPWKGWEPPTLDIGDTQPNY